MAKSQLPLTALRAFDAAARHLSFTKAADELHVTQGAVSQQIGNLEKRIGAALFDRLARKLQLTHQGELLAAALGSAFDQMDAALVAVSQRQARNKVLKFMSFPTIASRLVIPLLPRFHATFPDIRLQLSTGVRSANFDLEEVDLTIREGVGGWTGVRCDFLFTQTLVPVCSPRLLAAHRIETVDDLKKVLLIQSTNRLEDWVLWLSSMGRSHDNFPRGLSLDNSGLAYEAAIDSAGVAMGQFALVYNDVREGRLVVPLRHAVGQHRNYYLVSPLHREAVPAVAAFRDWMLKEMLSYGERSIAALEALLADAAPPG